MLYRNGNPSAAFERATKACQLAPDNPEYAYQRRLCGAGAVPAWHFNMVNDAPRNAAFAAAIAAQIKPDQLVLEVGTGAGLLALLAGRALAEQGGSGRVVTCEANPLLARTAVQIVAHNGLSERIQVIAKPSTELTVGADLPERADLLICEVFSVQVFSEGVLPTLEDAKARLLKADALVIPAAASARGALVASAALGRKVRVGPTHGFELSALNAFSPVVQYLQPGLELRLLSDALELFALDLADGRHFPAEKRELELRVRGPIAVAHLSLGTLEGLVSGTRVPARTLAGKRVVAASGIADPDAFVAQTKATGAAVQVATWRDHHDYRDEDVAWLAHAARRADHVVITQKDAVKLRDRWPAAVPEPLVALLDLSWEEGGDRIAAALDAVVTPVERL